MGLTTAKKLVLFGRPGWVLPEAALDFDFANDRYWVGGGVRPSSFISLTRASTGMAQNSAGVWSSFANDILRITDKGFLIEEARTNKCTNYNANPQALVTPTDAVTFNAAVTNMTASGDAAALYGVVDDTAAILAAGLQNITNNKVYKIDNSSGVAVSSIIVTGTVGNTNSHAISAFMRGTGSAQVRLQSQAVTSTALTSSYVRLSNVQTPGTTGRQLIVVADAGAVVYFTLNQLEEGSFVTSPIIVAGSSATRAADVPSLTGAAATAAANAKAAFFQTNSSAGGTAPYLINYSGGFVAYFISTSVARTFFSAADRASGTAGSGTIAGLAKVAIGLDSAGTSVVFNGGTKRTDATAVAQNSGTVYLGNRAAGDRALNGYMQRFALSFTKGAFDSRTA